MGAAHPTRPTGTAANPPSPAEPGLEQQQGEEKEEEELGCPIESRTHSVSPTGILCGAQPDKAATTQALLGSLPSFPGQPWSLWGFISVPSERQGQPRDPEGM